MRRVMAVYDVDPQYASRLADVVNQKEKMPFEVVAFTSLERLKSFGKENTIELLLVSAHVGREEFRDLKVHKIMKLADGETLRTEEEYPSIYKYQSCDGIIRDVMACYCEEEAERCSMTTVRSACVTGIYSPVGRCLKTSLALTIGQLMGQDSRALYITLEEYSGLSVLTGETFKEDLSDLMYYFEQKNGSLLRLNSMLHSIGSLDYIPPARYPEDLAHIGPEQTAALLKRIAQDGGYDNLILDVGSYGRRVFPILSLCNIVYMPVKEDSVSLAKLEEFFRHLDGSGNGELREKIKKLKLPFHNGFGRRENYLDQLVWGELGDYARQLLRGGGQR